MEFQIGKNSEYTFSVCIQKGFWAILFAISGWHKVRAPEWEQRYITIYFLCFSFGLEMWRWNE